MSIPGVSTRRPVAVWMLFLAVILLGGIAYVRLPIDLLPDVSYPRLIVYTQYQNVAPAEIERLVTAPIEAATAGVPGVQKVTSVSREGTSLVTVRFAWGTDMDFAVLNVREQMDNLKGQLPEQATRPEIMRVDPRSDPIMMLSIAGGGDLWQTKQLAETVFERRLEQLDGVAQATVTGGLDREIHVDVNPRLLHAYGLTIDQISKALAAANVSMPGGTILQGRYRYPIRALGEFQTVQQIGDVIIARQPTSGNQGQGNGGSSGAAAGTGASGSGGSGTGGGSAGAGQGFREIRLSDVATVKDGYAERESIARFDGEEAVGILVYKDAQANTVSTAKQVRTVIAQLAKEYPSVHVDVAYSQAGFISDSISNVVQSLVVGGLLAFLVLFLFLRDPRYPVAISLSIPISVVATFALMEASHVSLNIMSLGGLALGVGMLVDNSIVVLENIFRHREELDQRGLKAASEGAEEVMGAITASTLTTVAVFGPIIYVQGVAGELFKDLSLTVTYSLLASLIVALTLLPSLAGRFGGGPRQHLKPEARPRPVRRPGFFGTILWWGGNVARVPPRVGAWAWSLVRQLLAFWGRGVGWLLRKAFGRFLRWFERWFDRFAVRYHGWLEWSLDHPARILWGSAGALAVALAVASLLPRSLLPKVDQGAFEVRLDLPEGTPLATTEQAATVIEKAARADPAVAAIFSTIGRDPRAYAQGEEATGLQTAKFQVRLRPGARTAPVAARMRRLATRFPGATLTVETGQATALGQMLGGSQADLSVRVRGQNLDTMYTTAEEVEQRLDTLPDLGNVRVGSERGQPQIQVSIDRAACASYGIDPLTVAQTIQNAMQGDPATKFVAFDRKIDVMVRYPENERHSLGTLEGLTVQGVPIRQLVQVHQATGPAEIRREDQAREIPVYADVVQGGLSEAIGSIRAALRTLPMPRNVRWDVGGENEEMRQSFRDLGFAFGLALILVYMILAAQFESFIHPFTILTAVPLALVGAVGALAITGHGLNTMSLIGIVILVGIVVNDAIVKVDFIVQAQARGSPMRKAILEAGRVRLRPIIMTTVTTVFGLLPMALGIGRGSDLRAPLAITVIGGISVATALTLIVVPVVYQQVERVRLRVRGGATAPETAPASAD